MTPERALRILWGPSLETALDLAWPVVGELPLLWREPRPGSTMLLGNAASDADVRGRDYRLSVVARYVDRPRWSGGAGLQAFLDWAGTGNAFTLVPDPVNLPGLTVPGCYLDAPFDRADPALEGAGEQTVALAVRHPSVDLSLAWRGLLFEYAAGRSIADPVAATFTRASAAYEQQWTGYLAQAASGVLADGHYLSGLQTALLHQAVANDVTNPEDLGNASWTKLGVTVSANAARAPDQNLTADLLVEDGTTGNHLIEGNTFTIVAADPITGIFFLRSGGRYKGRVRISDAAQVNTFGVNYDLHAGTVATVINGTGTITAAKIVPMTNGWFMVWMRGTVGGAITSVRAELIFQDANAAESYAGNSASGTYLWGATAVHGSTKTVARYTPTTSIIDVFRWTWTPVPAASWWYAKFVDWGTTYSSAFPRVFELGAGGFANGSLIISGGNAGGKWTLTLHQAAGDVASAPSVAPAVGDVTELLGILYADGSVELRQSINGGVETTGGRSAAAPGGVPAVWSGSPTKLALGDDGAGGQAYAIGLNAVKVGPYVASGPRAVTTIAAARAA